MKKLLCILSHHDQVIKPDAAQCNNEFIVPEMNYAHFVVVNAGLDFNACVFLELLQKF
jgi:hypothetical protein